MSRRIAVAIPTELRFFLTKNIEVFNHFARLPKRVKQEYTSYVIDSATHKDRLCRAEKVTAWLKGDMRTAEACRC